MGEKLHRLNGSRRAKLGQLTKKINELNLLKENDNNVDKVEEECLNDFAKLFGEFNDLNKEYVDLLSEEEAIADQRNWFDPKSKVMEQFVSLTEKWITEVRKGTKQPHEDMEEEDALLGEDGVRPEDSASRVSGNNSVASSTASSTRKRAEAEKAALLARAASLKKKQALELQEASLLQQKAQQLQQLKVKEQLAMDTAIAECDAKLKVLEEY